MPYLYYSVEGIDIWRRAITVGPICLNYDIVATNPRARQLDQPDFRGGIGEVA